MTGGSFFTEASSGDFLPEAPRLRGPRKRNQFERGLPAATPRHHDPDRYRRQTKRRRRRRAQQRRRRRTNRHAGCRITNHRSRGAHWGTHWSAHGGADHPGARVAAPRKDVSGEHGHANGRRHGYDKYLTCSFHFFPHNPFQCYDTTLRCYYTRFKSRVTGKSSTCSFSPHGGNARRSLPRGRLS